MKKIITAFLVLISAFVNSQSLTDFEELSLQPDSFWISDATSNHFFTSDGTYFPSFWDTSFGGYWRGGFAYSNQTDSVASGYANQFSAKAGSGYNQSYNYVVSYEDAWFRPAQVDSSAGTLLIGMWLTNNTFAYNSMRDGDMISKKFGGVSGNDPDYFAVTFHGFENGVETGSPVTFYLADFRFADNSSDYIVKDWTYVSFSDFGQVDSVAFSFSSSDTGSFGINTPKYFCMDDMDLYFIIAGINDPVSETTVYPNPTTGIINFRDSEIEHIRILDLSGRCVYTQELNSGNSQVDLSFLIDGIYFAEIINGDKK